MESIKELRRICQESRLWADTWHGRHICRPLSIYITRLFLFTPISADQVTVIFFITGIAGSLFFLIGDKAADLIASLILQFWYLLDHVDGEVARYRKTTSLTGVFMDEMVHYIVHPLIFLCIGIGQSFMYGQVIYIVLSILAAFAIVYIPLGQLVRVSIFKKDTSSSGAGPERSVDRMSYAVRLFSVLHKSCTFPAVMNVITLLSLAAFLTDINLMNVALIYYSIIGTLVWVSRTAAIILSAKS